MMNHSRITNSKKQSGDMKICTVQDVSPCAGLSRPQKKKDYNNTSCKSKNSGLFSAMAMKKNHCRSDVSSKSSRTNNCLRHFFKIKAFTSPTCFFATRKETRYNSCMEEEKARNEKLRLIGDQSIKSSRDLDLISNPKILNKRGKHERKVSFTMLSVREYDLVLGDNPSCSEGTPTALGWNHADDQIFNLDEYEHNREPRRKISQLKMGPLIRREILCTKNEICENDIRRLERRAYKERRDHHLDRFFIAPT